MIIGSTAPAILNSWFQSDFFTRSYVIPGLVLLASPVAFFKSVARLGIPSLINQIFVGIALSIILYKVIVASTDSPIKTDPLHRTSFTGVLKAVGGLSYFYVCHDMAVQVCSVSYTIFFFFKRPHYTIVFVSDFV